jgi:hypothetical protein
MSYHLIPIDQLMQLDVPTLTYALFIFQRELDGTLKCLTETPESRTDEKLLDDLSHLLTLRKVFQGRVDEEAAAKAELVKGQSQLAAA